MVKTLTEKKRLLVCVLLNMKRAVLNKVAECSLVTHVLNKSGAH